MRRCSFFLMCFSLLFAPIPVFSEESAILTQGKVLKMLADGIAPEIVAAKIKSSECFGFETSASGLQILKRNNVPDAVMLAMVETKCKSKSELTVEEITRLITLHEMTQEEGSKLLAAQPVDPTHAGSPTVSVVEEERSNLVKMCPDCKHIMISYVDPQTGNITDNWITDNQRKYLEERGKKVAEGKTKAKFQGVKYRPNADYVILWTAAQGFRPYLYYVPHTETESQTVSGGYSSYGSAGQQQGTFSGTVTVEKQYYQQQSGQWPFVDAIVQVYDAHTGQKIYEIHHQGNWRWSKPEKDCLDDAMEFLKKNTTR